MGQAGSRQMPVFWKMAKGPHVAVAEDRGPGNCVEGFSQQSNMSACRFQKAYRPLETRLHSGESALAALVL